MCGPGRILLECILVLLVLYLQMLVNVFDDDYGMFCGLVIFSHVVSDGEWKIMFILVFVWTKRVAGAVDRGLCTLLPPETVSDALGTPPTGMHSCYHPRMRVGNVFSHVCLSVCLSIHLSVCMSVQAITFEPLHIETSFLVYRYIFTISRSRLSIKVICQGQGHVRKMYNFTYFNMLIIYMTLQIINKVKVTHQGQG